MASAQESETLAAQCLARPLDFSHSCAFLTDELLQAAKKLEEESAPLSGLGSCFPATLLARRGAACFAWRAVWPLSALSGRVKATLDSGIFVCWFGMKTLNLVTIRHWSNFSGIRIPLLLWNVYYFHYGNNEIAYPESHKSLDPGISS